MAFIYKRKITIDHTKVSNTDQTNFPVLISGTYSYLATIANGGKVVSSSGYDVGFYADNTLVSKLNWDIETYTASTGVVNYWVKIPIVSSTVDTVFYMAYGNSNILVDQSSKATWDSNFMGVWHLPDGTTLGLLDSTSSGYNGTNSGMAAVAGQVDGGISGDGTRKYADVTGTNLVTNSSMTIEGWLNTADVTNVRIAVSGANLSIGAQNAWIMMMNRTAGKLDFEWGNTTALVTGTTSLSTNTWYHVAMTRTGSAGNWTGVIYLNGAADKTTTGIATNPTGVAGDKTYIGDYEQDAGLAWNGKMDEIRVSNIARSADWIATEYNSQNSPSTFYTVGGEIASGGGVLPKNVLKPRPFSPGLAR